MCKVPTVTCGQLMPLKLSRTVWVYCSCVGADCPCRVSSQKVAVTETAVAFGPTILVNTWYLIDLHLDSSVGTFTLRGRVDGPAPPFTRTPVDVRPVGSG